MFETYRYVVDKMLRSTKYRSFSDLLNMLFEKHSYHNEQDKTRSKKQASKKRKRAATMKRSMTVDNLQRKNTTDGDKSKRNASIVDKSVDQESG